MRTHIVIAVDGTAASGKGTLARKLAELYNMAWLETGLLYRWVGYYAESVPHAVELAHELAENFDPAMLEGQELRGESASNKASLYSAAPEVREALINLQKSFVATLPKGRQAVILDGRDIGTVIAPDAEIKFFVDADVSERAKRRHKELQSQGKSTSYEAVLEAMRQRDARDIGRDVAPTVAAPDAYLIDTTNLDIAAVVAKAREHIEKASPELKAVR